MFITEIVAVQARYKERVQEIDAAHEVNVKAIESRFRRELEEREECYVEGRDVAIAFDVNAGQLRLNNPQFDSEPITTAAEQLGAEATDLSNQRLEMSVLARQDLLQMAEEWRLTAIRTVMQERDDELGNFVSVVTEERTTAGAPCATCSEVDERVRSNLCAARLAGIDCGFEAVKKQRFICVNCPSLGRHRPQGRCRVCPDQD